MLVSTARNLAALLLGAAIFTALPAQITTSTATGTQGTFTVSSTDLANAGQPTFASLVINIGSALYGSNVAKLNDGTTYEAADNLNTTPTLTPMEGSIIIFKFNTSINTQGYNLASIAVLTGSGQGRAGQNFVAYWTPVGSESFNQLFSVNQPTGDIEMRTNTFFDGGGPLATGVGSMAFVFLNTGGAESMYREIDIFGTATGAAQAIPEPSTYATLIGAISLGLVWMRRRKS